MKAIESLKELKEARGSLEGIIELNRAKGS